MNYLNKSIQYSNVQLAMLSQKPKVYLSNQPIYKEKSVKPYSLLPIGLMKISGSQMNNGAVKKQHSKISNKGRVGKENNENQMINSQCQSIVFQKSCNKENFFSKTIGSNLSFNKNQVLNQTSQNMELKTQRIFKDEVFCNSQRLTLENIANSMIEDEDASKLELKSLGLNFRDIYASEDQLEDFNDKNLIIDMKKKIRKLPKNKRLFKSQCQNNSTQIQVQNQSLDQRQRLTLAHSQLLKHAYSDRQVIIDASIFRNKLIDQRIDNDIDTDEQQVTLGVKRLHRCLSQAIQQNSLWEKEKKNVMNNLDQWSNTFENNCFNQTN